MGRTIGVSIYLTEAEQQYLRDRAAAEGLGIAAFLRARLREGLLAQRKLEGGAGVPPKSKAPVRAGTLFA